MRNEDLDPQRSRAEFARAMMEDLRWLGIRWSEGPDCGGPYGPYSQSERRAHYLEAWRRLRDGGFLYPCTCSRKDLAQAASAPNDADDEPVYPGTCRERKDAAEFTEPAGVNWRFRVPEGEVVEFADLNLGRQRYVAGSDFRRFSGLAARRCSGLPTRGRGRRRGDADHGSRAGRGFAEVDGAATAVAACAGAGCRSRLFSLRTGAGRRWRAAGETARCAEHPAFARERDDGGKVLEMAGWPSIGGDFSNLAGLRG